MLDATIELSRINSGSFNDAGVNAVAEALDRLSRELGGEREFIEVAPYVSVNAKRRYRCFCVAISTQYLLSIIRFKMFAGSMTTRSMVLVLPISRAAWY